MSHLTYRVERLFPDTPVMKVYYYKGYKVVPTDRVSEAMLLTFKDGSAWILVGSSFFEYPDESQEFILLHEIGHHIHKHKSTSADGLGYTLAELSGIYDSERRDGKKLGDEYEADQYAVSKIGKDIALRTFELFKTKYQKLATLTSNPDAAEDICLGLIEVEQRSRHISGIEERL